MVLLQNNNRGRYNENILCIHNNIDSFYRFCNFWNANDVPEKIAGTYLVTESKGAKRLWTFTNDGNILSTSSAQEQFSFSDQKGTWHITDDGTISVLLMAFGFNEDKSVSYPNIFQLMPHMKLNVITHQKTVILR